MSVYPEFLATSEMLLLQAVVNHVYIMIMIMIIGMIHQEKWL